MRKLFTNDCIVKNEFLDPDLCQRWEQKIFDRPDIFGTDVNPQYGQMAAFYGMIESGLNESYYRYAEKHNKYLHKEFAEIKTIVKTIGAMILQHSGLPPDSLPLVPRDKKYFLVAGFNLQIKSWALYNIHTDTEGLLLYPESIFDKNTRAYSSVISIKRTAQHLCHRGGDLDIWGERYTADALDAFYKPDGCSARSNRQRQKISYEVGKLVIFDSFMPHVVLPFKVKKKADRRISLVMHFNYRKHTQRNPFPHLEYWY
ncbi:MAG: hypothetical protein NTY26_14155 [Burkholderiales bacterium]|nr:hypothetical protein [Burkholderiales bacterium]